MRLTSSTPDQKLWHCQGQVQHQGMRLTSSTIGSGPLVLWRSSSTSSYGNYIPNTSRIACKNSTETSSYQCHDLRYCGGQIQILYWAPGTRPKGQHFTDYIFEYSIYLVCNPPTFLIHKSCSYQYFCSENDLVFAEVNIANWVDSLVKEYNFFRTWFSEYTTWEVSDQRSGSGSACSTVFTR